MFAMASSFASLVLVALGALTAGSTIPDQAELQALTKFRKQHRLWPRLARCSGLGILLSALWCEQANRGRALVCSCLRSGSIFYPFAPSALPLAPSALRVGPQGFLGLHVVSGSARRVGSRLVLR